MGGGGAWAWQLGHRQKVLGKQRIMGVLYKNQGTEKLEVCCSHLAREAGVLCCQVYVAVEYLKIVIKCVPRKSEVQ